MKEYRYKDYIIRPSLKGERFDLLTSQQAQKLGTGTKKEPNGEVYTKEVFESYDMTLEYVLDKIIKMEINKNQETGVLQDFLTEYRQEKESLNQLIKKL